MARTKKNPLAWREGDPQFCPKCGCTDREALWHCPRMGFSSKPAEDGRMWCRNCTATWTPGVTDYQQRRSGSIEPGTREAFKRHCREVHGESAETDAFCARQMALYGQGVRDVRLADVAIFLIDRCGY